MLFRIQSDPFKVVSEKCDTVPNISAILVIVSFRNLKNTFKC